MSKKGSLRKLSELTRETLSNLKGAGKTVSLMLELRQRWKEIVGDALSQQLMPLGLNDGILDIGAFSSTWMNEAQFFQNTILEKIQIIAGEKISNLRFRIVSRKKVFGEQANRTNQTANIEKRALAQAEVDRIDEVVKNCTDTSLKRRLKSLFRRVMEREKHR